MERNEKQVTDAALSALGLCVQLSNDAMARMEQQVEQLKAELAYVRGVNAQLFDELRKYPAPAIGKPTVELKVAA